MMFELIVAGGSTGRLAFFFVLGGGGGWGGVITFLLLRSLGLFFCYLFLCYACRLPHHLARNTSCYAFGRKCYVTLAGAIR